MSNEELNTEDIGEIVIPNLNQITNEMAVQYALIGSNISDVLSVIDVIIGGNSDTLAEVSPRVGEDNDRNSEIKVMFGGKLDTIASIQPIIGHNVPAELIIFPGNVMEAMYEIVQPPVKKLNLLPNQDAFTRDNPTFSTVNYGLSNSLNVGIEGVESYRSFMRFDFTDFSKSNVIIDSTLRIYYNGEFKEDTELELRLVSKKWSEFGITDRNKPQQTELIVNEYFHNRNEKYVEFVITEVTLSWIADKDKNLGFSIINLSNSLITFRSRESGNKPRLTVSYYDSRVYSASRTQTPAEVSIMHGGKIDVVSEVTVKSTIGSNDVMAVIEVHRAGDFIDKDINAEISITREKLDSEVTVAITNCSDILSELFVEVESSHETETELIVSKVLTEAEITVAYNSNVESEVTAIVAADNDVESKISVTRIFIDSEIFIKYLSDILAEVVVEIASIEDIFAELAVTREYIKSELLVRALGYSGIDSELIVRALGLDNVPSEVSVTREYADVEIIVRALGESVIISEITPRLSDYSELDSEVFVTRSNIPSEVNVVETSYVEAEVLIKFNEDIETEINVHVYADILAEIEAVLVSDVKTEVVVTKQNIQAEITIPYWDDSDIESEIIPRILGIEDIYASIQIGDPIKVGESYVFII